MERTAGAHSLAPSLAHCVNLSRLLSTSVPLSPHLVYRNILDMQSTLDSVWQTVTVTQVSVSMFTHGQPGCASGYPGFYTVAAQSTLVGTALCPDHGLRTGPYFLGTRAVGWFLL